MKFTSSPDDRNVLWLPDSSGFIYLKATGQRLGDGAGPEHILARYDLKTKRSSEYSFVPGFWGGIEWLMPGKTVLVHNGFDDVFGLKTINLQTKTEQQISETSDLLYTSYAINPDTYQILVSELGHFRYFNDKGEQVGSVDWVTGLDQYTEINPAFNEEINASEPYYTSSVNVGSVGPSRIAFSKDGKFLTYLLGAIGSSGDDIVSGQKLVLCKADGSEPSFITTDYVQISYYEWSPSAKQIFVVFSISEQEGQYVGVIPVTNLQ